MDLDILWRATTADEEAFIDVEATRPQLDATLAGLRAQPAMFISFAVKPNADGLRGEQSAIVPAGRYQQSSSQFSARRSLSEATSAGGEQQSRQNLQPATQQNLQQSPPAWQQLSQKQVRFQQSVEPPARQRVVFVLHLVGNDHPPAAAKRPGGVYSGPSKPAEQTAPPANATKQKE